MLGKVNAHDSAIRPAWCSTALRRLVEGPPRRGELVGRSTYAWYVELPDECDPPVLALVTGPAVRLPICAGVLLLPEIGEAVPVEVGAGRIVIGEHSWQPARWWEPRPVLNVQELPGGVCILAAMVADEPAGAFGIDPQFGRRAASALVAGDPGPAIDLLGAGPGLTPAGDDVVAGALAALALVDRLDPTVAAAVSAAAKVRTSRLSAALVVAAARGQVIPEAARLLRSMTGPDGIDGVTRQARMLFAVGGTSGRALALGLSTALTTVTTGPIQEER